MAIKEIERDEREKSGISDETQTGKEVNRENSFKFIKEMEERSWLLIRDDAVALAKK